MGHNDKDFEQNIGTMEQTNNLTNGSMADGNADVAVKVRSDLSPEEEFHSTLQQQSKAVYEEMKYDCEAIEQEIGVNK
jgi:hypothetical protein